MPPWRFIRAYVKSMRLYYAFITGIAGWIGVSYYHYIRPDSIDHGRGAVILVILFLSWGINQIINDYLGLPEDRINAPNRPMVTGELHPGGALAVSGALLAGAGAVSWFLNPWAVAPLALGVLLNVLYEYAKGWSLLGNVVFGFCIAMCTAYGFAAAGPLPEPLFIRSRVSGVLLVALLNGLMTYYTYFKDYKGDLAAGKRTFVVKYGINVARYVGVLGAFLPTLAVVMLNTIGWLPTETVEYPDTFIFCCVMTLFLQLWTAVLFFKHPVGTRTYLSLATNIRACVAGQITLIARFNDILALYLLCASYVFIGFLFDRYKDTKS